MSAVLLAELAPFLRLVTHQEFKDQLLPVLQKQLLRSPEVVLSSVATVLAAVSLDLSVYAGELLAGFLPSLKSKEDAVREEAGDCVTALARQCSDPGAVEILLNTTLAVLGGSQGKISLAGAKISFLAAVGSLAGCGVSGTGLTALATTATTGLVKVLEEEQHEGTLVAALTALGRWAAKFTTGLPESLLAWLPKGLQLKSATHGVRCGYLACLAGALQNSNSLDTGASLLPALSRVVENAVKQPGQVAMVSEAVLAAGCLVRLAAADPATEQQLQDLFALLTDTEKCMFYQERFMAGAEPGALVQLAVLATALLTTQADRLPDSSNPPLLRCLAWCLLSPQSEVRRAGVRELARLGAGLGGADLVGGALQQAHTLLLGRRVTAEGDTGGELAASDALPASAVISGLAGLVYTGRWDRQQDGPRLALALLPACHLPAVCAREPGLWARLVSRLGWQPGQLVSQHKQQVLEILDSLLGGPAGPGAVTAVARISPDLVCSHTLSRARPVLTCPDLLAITAEQYQVFLTPAGEVYDKAAIEQLASDKPGQNVKRENKAYSYKEQMEELALRKELEAKKAKEGL